MTILDKRLFEGRRVLHAVMERIETLENRMDRVAVLKWKSLEQGYHDKVAQARYLQEKLAEDIANVKSVL